MSNQAMVIEFLKPSWIRLILTTVFVLVTVAGSIQTWGFGGEEFGVPKPPFYDELRPYPFWGLMLFLLLPVLLIAGGGFPAGPEDPVIGIIVVIYLYFLACLIAFLGNRVKKDWFGGPAQKIANKS